MRREEGEAGAGKEYKKDDDGAWILLSDDYSGTISLINTKMRGLLYTVTGPLS
jgi:hypothetical protein